MKHKYLDELLNTVDVVTTVGDLHIDVEGIHNDSRKIGKNDCFVAIKGFQQDGLDYVTHALKNGANAIVAQQELPENLKEQVDAGRCTWVQVRDDRTALSRMAAAFYDNPSDRMVTVGITGTNGKTTVMSLIAAIFNEEQTATIGTLGMKAPGISRKPGLTTPEIIDIFDFLSAATAAGCRYLVMETSSVALKLHRVEDLAFDQAIFTNFTGDHLDFHITMEDYFESKMLLFQKLRPHGKAIINLDDPRAGDIISGPTSDYITYGFAETANVRPLNYNLTLDGIQAELQTPNGTLNIESRLLGRINLLNILAAVSAGVTQGIPFSAIASAVKGFKTVKGRLDIAYKGDFTVLIDYAHTDEALASLLRSLREITKKRIIVVFGAGGSRDKTKRPRMGAAVSRYADLAIVTSDNPRKEEPQAIIDDVLAGFSSGQAQHLVQIHREQAIAMAINEAKKDDLVVIAGKGHEDYQIFKDKTIHFDDYEMVRKYTGSNKNG